MIEIEKPRIDCEQLAEDGSYGKFVVEPLERGYLPAFMFRRNLYIKYIFVRQSAKDTGQLISH